MRLTSLTVQKASAVTALTTVQAARNEIGGVEPDDTAASDQLARYIGVATARIRKELGYEPASQTYAYSVQFGRDERLIALPTAGVNVVVARVEREGTPLADDQWRLSGALLLGRWVGDNEYTVYYDAGWPVTGAAVDVPADVEQAALTLVTQLWSNRGRAPETAAESIPGLASVSFDEGRLPWQVRNTIDLYRIYGL